MPHQAVVIGGGVAGLAACVALRKKDKQVEIILVEPKHYFQVPWAVYRSMFDENVAQNSIFELKPWAEKHSITHIASTVTRLTETTCTLANGQVLEHFGLAVVCSGAVCKWPSLGRSPANWGVETKSNNDKKPKKGPKGNVLTKEERLQQLQHDGQKLLDSRSVLVVGGGLIGVETAGDLAYFAQKQDKPLQVTLVHSGETLIPEFPQRSAHMVHKKLQKLGVRVILNDKVVPSKNEGNNKNQPTTTFHLQNADRDVSASHVVWTTGISPQNHAFLDPSYLTKKGWVKVDETFQITNTTKLFAFGDCCNLLPNSAIQVLGAMPVLGHNLKVALDGASHDAEQDEQTTPMSKPSPKQKRLKKAMAHTEMYICTIGKKDGVALTPLGGTGLGLPLLKNKTMFLPKPKMALGLVPS
jgi:NADH dehydrogenase FAD-containing subunit